MVMLLGESEAAAGQGCWPAKPTDSPDRVARKLASSQEMLGGNQPEKKA